MTFDEWIAQGIRDTLEEKCAGLRPTGKKHRFSKAYKKARAEIIRSFTESSPQLKKEVKMKVAVVGSRGLTVKDLGKYLPEGTTEIISGGARGVDACAKEYALSHGIKLTEFKPDYARYGQNVAPLKRNITIIENADIVLAFWNGSSRGTKFVIENCKRMGVEVKVYQTNSEREID